MTPLAFYTAPARLPSFFAGSGPPRQRGNFTYRFTIRNIFRPHWIRLRPTPRDGPFFTPSPAISLGAGDQDCARREFRCWKAQKGGSKGIDPPGNPNHHGPRRLPFVVGFIKGGVTRMLPLEGIKVVSIEQAVAAPFASRQLADFGARVIKIERPGTGDFARNYDEKVRGMSAWFVWLNRSKRSLTLDLKHPDAGAILAKLLEDCDVLIHNLAPGSPEKLGLASSVLVARYPRLIVCEISGYGSEGPYRDKKAYDLLVQFETGLVSITGTPETPSKAGISAADIAAGMYAFSGILLALRRGNRPAAVRCCKSALRCAGGMDVGRGVPNSLQRDSSPARASRARVHSALWPICHRRRKNGEPRRSKRTGVGGVLFVRAAETRTRD